MKGCGVSLSPRFVVGTDERSFQMGQPLGCRALENKVSRFLLFNLLVNARFGTAESHSISHYRVFQTGLPEQVILSPEGAFLVIYVLTATF